ncbi:MAG: GAF domain-containing protein, partial [Chloroflexota bacterium]
ITPTAEVNSNDLLTQITAVAYPIGDLVLFVGLIAVLFRRPDPDTRSAFSIFLVGLAFFILSDLAFGYTSLAGTYLTGSWVDAGWNVAMGFIILAVLRQLHRAPAAAEPRWTRLADRFVEALPLVALAASYGLLIYVAAVDTSQASWWYLSGAALLMALVIVRQIARASFGNLSLRAKLIIAFAGVAVMSVAAMAVVADRISRSGLTAEVGTNLNSLANSQALTISNLLSGEVDTLQAFSLNQTVRDAVKAANRAHVGDQATIQANIEKLDQQWRTGDNSDPLIVSVLNNSVAERLTEYSQTFTDNVEVFVTDKYGANVAATNRTSDYYQADKEWWQGAYSNGQGDTYIGQPQFDESSATYGVNIAIPLYEPGTKEVVGILRTTYRTGALSAALFSTHFGQNVDAYLFLPDGQLLNGKGRFESIDPALMDQLQASADETYTELNIGGAPKLVSGAPVKSFDPGSGDDIARLGWTLVIVHDSAEALQSVNAASRATVLTSLAVLLVAAVLGVFVAQVLAAPIVRLTEVAERVRAGDLNTEARVESEDEIGALASTFNSMTAQLRDTLAGLERRVADRTRALAISADVSRRLSTLLDQQQLVSEVVDQLQTAFNYYHVHIYLWDEKRENLVMVGGTGEAGRIMLGRGHQIPKGRGLVGRAADTNLTVLVTDVSKEAGWLPNPLLPETKAEVAVPIALGERVLGVLDVQHNMVSGLRQEDAELIQSVANQVAIGLQNIRAYVEARRQAHREALVGAIGQKIQSAANVETALQIAVREVGRALGGTRVGVRLKAGGPTNGHDHESPNTEEVR